MKARVKATYYASSFTEGEIVEILPNMEADAADVFNIPAGKCYLCKKEDGSLKYIIATNLELLQEENTEPDYWENLKHQYAGMAMQGMIRTVGHNRMYSPEKIAIYAEACAHALIQKLKEERYGHKEDKEQKEIV